MNMASLFREMTDAQRVRELELQRFWLVLAIILLAILCAVLAFDRRPEPISTPSASCGRVTHQDSVTEAEKLKTVLGDKKHAQGLAVARPAGSETFPPTFINQNGRRILAVVVPLDAEGAR